MARRPENPALNDPLQMRVAVLTNILPNYRVALLQALNSLVPKLRIFLSARTESDRKGPIDWGTLDVRVQRSLSWTRRFTNVYGFQDVSHIHIPLDTLPRLAGYRPQVVVTGEFGARSLFAVLYRLLVPKTKVVLWATLSQRTEQTRGALRLILRRFLLRHVDCVLVNGADGEGYIRKLGFQGKIVHVPYVVDNLTFSAREHASAEPGVLTLFYAGQLIERKGLAAFCEVLAAWCWLHPAARVHFRIAGAGPEYAKLKVLQNEQCLSLDFLGHLNVVELAREYSRASLYVFPTYADEWGVVVNEALLAGVPVLGSCYSQAVMELIREGENGWVFDPADRSSTFEALEKCLGTAPERLRQMSEISRRNMEDYTPSMVAQRLRDALMSLVDPPSVT